jgi:hypothetical protein
MIAVAVINNNKGRFNRPLVRLLEIILPYMRHQRRWLHKGDCSGIVSAIAAS